MLEYYRIFTKEIKSLPHDPQFLDFYHSSEEQKNNKLLFVSFGTGLPAHAIYK